MWLSVPAEAGSLSGQVADPRAHPGPLTWQSAVGAQPPP